MSLFDQNTKALFERYPEIKAQVLSESPDPNLQSEEIEGKSVVYYNTDDGIMLLDSLYNTEGLLSLWRDSIPKPALYNKFFLFGLGNGMMAQKLLDTTDSTNRVIAYEADCRIILYMMHYFDMTELFTNKRFTLLIGSTLSEKLSAKIFDLLDYTDLGTLQYYVYPNYNYLFFEEYLQYMSGLESAIGSVTSSQNVMGHFKSAIIDNAFSNIMHLCRSKSLENLYQRIPEGLPAIVVAAGPSLDKNVSKLKDAKNKAFIIAADSALRTLLKAEVFPDMCISIDPKKLSKHFSNDLANDIPIVCQMSSNHEILKTHRTYKFFVNDLNQHIAEYFDKRNKVFPVLSSGGSVANDAMSVCMVLGFKTIILVGQDLAYTDNKTHSVASVRGEWGADISQFNDNVMIEDIYGKPIVSSFVLTLYRDWIEGQIVTHPELRVVDATEGGAKIKGTEIMTLEEAINSICTKEFDYSKTIEETDRFLTEAEEEEFLLYIKGLPGELKVCEKKAGEGIELYERMLKMIYSDKYRSQGFKKLFEGTKEVTDYIDKSPSMEYVKYYIQDETNAILKNIYRTEDDERSELIASCKVGIDYLGVVKRGIKEMIPVIEEKIQTEME